MDALVFPSELWVADWTRRCNASAAYLTAARGWDGVVALEIGPEADYPPRPLYIQLCATDGQWSSYRFGPDPALAEHASFLLRAPYSTWKQVVRQQIAPLPTIIRGSIRVEGRLFELLTWTESLRVMTQLAGQVDTAFGDETRRD